MFDQNPKLQAFLAHAGVASRRKAEELIEAGRVVVNGEKAHIGQRVDPAQDKVSVDGRVINSSEDLVYILLNKPVGIVSTTSDDLGRRTVLDLLPAAWKKYRLYPVGRLDQESQGLMLLTNDGELAYRLTHPKFEIPKTYEVLIDRKPSFPALNMLRNGVRLSDGVTAPAEVEVIDSDDNQAWLTITIHEGRNRQVRRMLERVGYDVKKLRRIQLGPFLLADLNNQPHRQLTPAEIDDFKDQLTQI
jgi:23S rRNA pseudouridine2605 synthase